MNKLTKSFCAAALVLVAIALSTSQVSIAKPAPTPTWTDAALALKEYPDFKYLGEYTKGGSAIQVAPAQGRFYVTYYQGGLPGAGWDGSAIGREWVERGDIEKRLSGYRRVDRGAVEGSAKPPAGALILFDGSDVSALKNGKIVNGLLQPGTRTNREFTDFKLHFECLVPFKPELPLSHPDRGNSGVFALGVYEIQVADTFGLDPSPEAWTDMEQIKTPDTWCGSIYGLKTPDVNMCLPPLVWQSFDIEFKAARYEGERKVSNARITVWQNGVLVHDDVELSRGTGGGPSGPRAEKPSGPIVIQNHHNPTQYRNVWVVAP